MFARLAIALPQNAWAFCVPIASVVWGVGAGAGTFEYADLGGQIWVRRLQARGYVTLDAPLSHSVRDLVVPS